VGGAGLGLTICRGIIAAHGGRIWTEPRPGGGAAFRFTLPLQGPPLGVVPTEAQES
jgi:two-component system sensor histidine kinase KdpD